MNGRATNPVSRAELRASGVLAAAAVGVHAGCRALALGSSPICGLAPGETFGALCLASGLAAATAASLWAVLAGRRILAARSPVRAR